MLDIFANLAAQLMVYDDLCDKNDNGAMVMEREPEDEREVNRARKAHKWQRKQATGKELDGLLTELGEIECGDYMFFFINSLQET